MFFTEEKKNREVLILSNKWAVWWWGLKWLLVIDEDKDSENDKEKGKYKQDPITNNIIIKFFLVLDSEPLLVLILWQQVILIRDFVLKESIVFFTSSPISLFEQIICTKCKNLIQYMSLKGDPEKSQTFAKILGLKCKTDIYREWQFFSILEC